MSQAGLQYTITISIVLCIITVGCVEIIEFETEREGNRLIVDGQITNTSGPHHLRLSLTADNERVPMPFSAAKVTIFNDLGQQEDFREPEQGSYMLEGNIVKGEAGRTYYIEIELHDGTVYRSEPETMPSATAKDSSYYEIVKEEEVSEYGVVIEERLVRIYIDSDIPQIEGSLYLRWNVEEVFSNTTIIPGPAGWQIIYCYIYGYPNAQNIVLFNGEELQNTKIERQLLATREIDYSFLERHYFNVIQYSMTAQAYRYWFHVDQVTNRTGSIFDTPPGLVTGNIYNVKDATEEVLGYFGASLVDTTRFFLTKRDIPFNIGSRCNCTTCLQIPGSTLEGPEYF